MRFRLPAGKAVRRSRARDTAVRTLAVVGAGALALHGSRLFLNLAGPTLPYTLHPVPADALDSERFVQFLSVITDAPLHNGTRIDVLKNGAAFYPAELEAIRHARTSINLEFYEFLAGEVAREFLDALAGRARAGVAVKMVVDAAGSFATRDTCFDGLRAAGGRVQWYRPLRWDTWPNMNNRTHRKLLVVDGAVGFIGGAGVADHWLLPKGRTGVWRDTMVRVEGTAVAGLASVFAENWLECSGEILAGADQFPFRDAPGQTSPCLVINSTPAGGATRARILFQTLIDCARETIRITTPYFLPDRSARHALVRAVRERKVRVQVLTAGAHSDHPAVRRLSRSLDLKLLQAGAEVYEYRPSMIHAKLMTVDGKWSVVGSTNFDHRSFALNDEVNLAVLGRELAARIDQDFEADLAESTRLSMDALRARSFSAEAVAELGWVFRREE